MTINIGYLIIYLTTENHYNSKGDKEMTFEQVMKQALIEAYISEYGAEAWNNQTEAEKSETLHKLLGSFLTVAKRRG